MSRNQSLRANENEFNFDGTLDDSDVRTTQKLQRVRRVGRLKSSEGDS
jgi:hypothetical protein